MKLRIRMPSEFIIKSAYADVELYGLTFNETVDIILSQAIGKLEELGEETRLSINAIAMLSRTYNSLSLSHSIFDGWKDWINETRHG